MGHLPLILVRDPDLRGIASCDGSSYSSGTLSKRQTTHLIGTQLAFKHIISVATPAEPRGEKHFFVLCKFWAVKNFLKLLNIFQTRFGSFFGPVFVSI